MKNNRKLFCYGTLKRGFKYHTHYLAKQKFLDTDTVKGTLYGRPGIYPILTNGKNDVPGEVFSVTKESFEKSKCMEENAGYETRLVTTGKGTQAYCFMIPDHTAKTSYKEWLSYPISEWTPALDRKNEQE